MDKDKGREEYAGGPYHDKLPQTGGREKATDRIVTFAGEVVSADKVDSSEAEGTGYISHFATCTKRRR